MKKNMFITALLIILLLATACAGTHKIENNKDNISKNDSIENKATAASQKQESDEKAEATDADRIRYTGELITDGFYSTDSFISFVPDMETRLLLEKSYETFKNDDSIRLYFDDIKIVQNLPTKLGIYKVEIEFKGELKNGLELNAIALTDNIGTIEYEPKAYTTNDLDENVRVKDMVCGLIVTYVNMDKETFIDDNIICAYISFAGQLEVEGIYNLFFGGPYHNYINIGTIIPNENSLKNMPTFKGQPADNGILFHENNELYDKIAKHSVLGSGKFKLSNYYMMCNIAGGINPSQTISEIVSLDDNYKGLFEFDKENSKHIRAINDKYILICETPNDENISNEETFYLVGREKLSKIKILAANGLHYDYESIIDDNNPHDILFQLRSDGNNLRTATQEKEQLLAFSLSDYYYGDKITDAVVKTVDYAIFKDGASTKKVYKGDEILGMRAESISIDYNCTEDEKDELLRIKISFSGKSTVTGTLTHEYIKDFNMYRTYFVCDKANANKLPCHIEDTRDLGFMIDNENIEELIGTEAFSKKCTITIDNYNIFYAQTEALNSARLVAIEFLPEQ